MNLKHKELSSDSNGDYFLEAEDFSLTFDTVPEQVVTERCSFKKVKTVPKDNGQEIITTVHYLNEFEENLIIYFYEIK